MNISLDYDDTTPCVLIEEFELVRTAISQIREFKPNDVVRYIGAPNDYLVAGRLYVVGLEYGQIFVWDGVGYDYGVEDHPEDFELVYREDV